MTHKKSTEKSKSTARKRNRSKNSPGEQTTKKSKSTTDSSDNSQTDSTLATTDATSVTTVSENTAAATPVPPTPKEKLSFEQDQKDVISPELKYPDAPAWAKDLMDKLARVESLAKDTQTTIAGALKSNLENTTLVKNLTKKVCELEIENAAMKNENVDLRERLLLLEFHQRRNNLVFDGIPEPPGPESGRDCYMKVIEILSYLPNLDVSSVRIERCHRLGSKQKYRNRSIIAKFNWYGDVTDILGQRSHLPSGIYVSEDYPEEWQERRRLLRPILNLARKTSFRDSAFMTRDKLIIDGKQFTVSPINNLAELPLELTPAASCEKRDPNTIAFLGPHSVYSNFHSAHFIESGVRYNCAEQMIQAEKAALFKDKVALQRIMKSTSPYKIKEIGGRVRNFDREVWAKNNKQIATRAVKAKFEQNEPLANILQCSGTLDIVESSRAQELIYETRMHWIELCGKGKV